MTHESVMPHCVGLRLPRADPYRSIELTKHFTDGFCCLLSIRHVNTENATLLAGQLGLTVVGVPDLRIQFRRCSPGDAVLAF